jgi:DNA polymerase I-like protein with 3'-5' exonuclease and polymerase domains
MAIAIPNPAVVDFETGKIQRRPLYPPFPVGVSIKMPGERKAKYYAWAHPAKNNCSENQAKAALHKAWSVKDGVLFHNGKFDYDVATTRLDFPKLSWDKIHDTLFLLFLYDPHARNLSLKPSAERLLGMPPEERDAVEDWLQEHRPNIREKDSKGKLLPWGAYISEAPGDVVGTYANGDTLRTELLYKKLYKDIAQRDMLDAYNRERRLMPILLRNEQEGIRVDLDKLVADIKMYEAALDKADNWLRKRLKDSSLNIDSDDDFGKALDRCGIVTDWVLTRTGKKSVSKKNLTLDMYNDKKVASVYGYRNRLATCLRMFMIDWRDSASQTGGTIHTTWNQVRQNHGDEQAGTRTGRPSCTPNFFNIPKVFEGIGDGYEHPEFLKVPHLPMVRQYTLPDKGCLWLHRDYNQQELRILAHFEDGELLQGYLKNPKLDVHGIVQKGLLEIAGLDFIRTFVKRYVFQKVYGGGIPAICAALNVDVVTAKKVIAATMAVLPGYKALEKSIQRMGRAGEPIVTWGGREYYCEPAGYSKKFKRTMTFEYKLLNYLIQGSAADCTKEAMIRYDEHPKREARFLVSVYDEMNVSSPPKRLKEEDKILKDVMESVKFDLPMISDSKAGPNWGTLTKYEVNG